MEVLIHTADGVLKSKDFVPRVGTKVRRKKTKQHQSVPTGTIGEVINIFSTGTVQVIWTILIRNRTEKNVQHYSPDRIKEVLEEVVE